MSSPGIAPPPWCLTDYGALAPEQRNILRLVFCDPRVRAAQYDWDSVARFVVGAFRADAARAGATAKVEALVDELSRLSPEFAAMWRDNDVRSYGEGVKRMRHPIAGPIAFEYSAFAVDGRPRSRHGGLQSGDAGGCAADQSADQSHAEGQVKRQAKAM